MSGRPPPPTRPLPPRPRPVRAGRGWAVGLSLSGALAAALAGCGAGTTPPAPTAAPAGSPAATAPPVAPVATPAGGFGDGRVALGPIVWTTSLDPVRGGPTQTATAVPDDAPRFWAAVPLLRAEVGVRLRADWSYNGTPMPALSAETVVADAGAAWAAFDLSLPPGERWPIGDYAVTVSVDGAPAVSASVPVAAAGS